ncbi:MAG TPA: hydantoinase B/oxoprolinase family protein, partial [Burkholderiales bacterium]
MGLGRRLRIGLDIGGTFTDFVLYDAEARALSLYKCLTTPHDPSVAALEGLAQLTGQVGISLAEVDEIVHGTTLVTNAIIERRGARLGLITTAGFRDVLEMGIEQRYDIYDLFLRFPEPLVPRRHRLAVPERLDRDGRVVVPLDLDALRAAVRRLADERVEALALCFLHSYANPAHEQAAANLIRREFPALSLSLSSEVVAELREYPRAVTTCANAYVQPLVERYLANLEASLAARGFRGALRLMHSAGGLVSPAAARRFPIRLLESGPAGGALASALVGKLAQRTGVISFDMGGTTAKACLVENERTEVASMMEAARVHRFKPGSGLPIKAPVIDMIEIGAGGGSIAAIDEVGLLRVGPRSAGADPGPACYGRGGSEPTVTDANLLLGYYDPAFFLGGRMTLEREAAHAALARLGEKLGLSALAAAHGIHEIVTENMAAAARIHLVEKGKDPRNYALVGFGGAGPAHAAGVARVLGVREVIIPPASGVASCLGFLAAPLSFERVRSQPMLIGDEADAAAIERILHELESQARALLAEAGVAHDAMRVERSADMRLAGQMHEINVPLPAGPIGPSSLEAIRRAFAEVYTKRYTSLYAGAAIEAISWRVRVLGPLPTLSLDQTKGARSGANKRKASRQAWFGRGFLEVPVYDRYALVPGDRIEGPAIVEEREATTVVPPGDELRVDEHLNLRLSVAVAARPAAMVVPGMALADAVARIEADPISLEIMWSRLVTVVDEMWLTVVRTAFSLIISEAQDFACELLDARGEPLAHSPRAMPVFNLCLPRAVKALLAKFPPQTLAPGDVLVTNDPWLCAGHLFDVCVLTPVFRDARLVGFVCTVGHVSDIGGTKDSLAAREIYEEGIQIPPLKLYRAGQPNEDLFTLIAENVRNSAQVLGDLHAFMSANAVGAERLSAFMDEYGMHELVALAAVLQGRSEKAMREAIAALPDGVYSSEVWNNPLGEPMRYPLRLIVKGDTIEVDFAGAPPQQQQGGLNCTMNYTAAHSTYPLKCMLTPNVRGNAGDYRPFTVKAPQGSILNCDKPMAVNLRTRTGWYIAPNIFGALARAAPERVQAATGLPVAITIYGRDADGRIYSDHLFMGGGQGASNAHDGLSALLWPTSAAGTSVELFEQRVPVLVMEKTLIPDSGGPGRHRGGLGQRVRVRKLKSDGLATLASVYPEGVGIGVEGLFGGRAGRSALGVVRNAAGAMVKDCGTGALVSTTSDQEIIEVCLSGGAGFGPPAERPALAIERDVAEGYVTPEGAVRDYGARIERLAD